jgi:hypothetical protein
MSLFAPECFPDQIASRFGRFGEVWITGFAPDQRREKLWWTGNYPSSVSSRLRKRSRM